MAILALQSEAQTAYFPQPWHGIRPDDDSERVERVSLNDDDTEIVTLWPPDPPKCGGPKGSAHPWISDDGDRIVFSTRALTVAGESNPSNKSHLLMRQVSTGQTFLISGKNPVGGGPGTQNLASGGHDFAKMSGDGKWIAWATGSGDIVAGPPNGFTQVYLHEVDTGTTTRLSEVPGRTGNGDSARPFLSEFGDYVAFETQAINLYDNYGTLPNGPPTTPIFPNGTDSQIHLWHRDPQTQAVTITWVSVGQNANGDLIHPDAPCLQASVSENGGFVAWESAATNLTPEGGNGSTQVFVRDMTTGEIVLVSKSVSGGPGDGTSQRPMVSRDGSWVAFESLATDLIVGDTNGITDAFVWERATGDIVRVSVDSSGNQILDNGRFPMYTHITANGRFVLFSWGGTGFNDPSGQNSGNKFEFYLHDRDYDTDGVYDEQVAGSVRTIRVSNVPTSSGPGVPGNNFSGGNAAASFDGRYAVYMSLASDFVDANDVGGVDTNGDQDCDQCGQEGCPADWGRDVFRREMYTLP